MNPAKPRNAFRLSFEHLDDEPPGPLFGRFVFFLGVSVVLAAFPVLDSGVVRHFLASAVAP